MKGNRFLKYTLLLVFAALAAAPAAASEYILALKAGGTISQVTARYGLTLVRPLSDDSQTVYLVSALTAISPEELKEISSDPEVKEIEPDEKVVSSESPPAPAPPMANASALAGTLQNNATVQYYGATVRGIYVQQPAAALIQIFNALAYGSGSGIVAVIDTGVDPNHPALKDVLVPGYDFTRNEAGYASELADLSQSTVAILDQSTVAILDSDPDFPVVLNQSTVAILDQSTVAILDTLNLPPDFGHGTMVSGLIHLVAPSARIMPLKAFRADGSANISDIVRAIYYAVDHNARVINMSFSSATQYASVTAAIQYASSHRVICVASAGNDGKKLLVYPAGDRGVVGVASITSQDRRSVFSNYGTASVKTSAPGEALITTYPGNLYAGVWGTSFSAALTSGAMALFTEFAPGLGAGDMSDVLEHGYQIDADGLGDARLDVYTSLVYCLTGMH
jgi:subtilisin family serine protease